MDIGAEMANVYGWRNYAWSPTGRTLAVFHRNAMNVGVFSFKDFATGAVRDLRARDSSCAPGMVWSRDGRFLLCGGSIADPHRRGAARDGIIRIDIETGDASFVTPGASPVPSSDNQTIYLIRGNVGEAKESALMQFDIASNTERELLRRPTLEGLALSPDGHQIAVTATGSPSGTRSVFAG